MLVGHRVAEHLGPYLRGRGGHSTDETQHLKGDGELQDATDEDIPLLTVSDINPDMLEVRCYRLELWLESHAFCVGTEGRERVKLGQAKGPSG